MCGRYVVTNPVSKTKKIVKSAIKVEDIENYNAHPYQNLPVIKKYSNGNTLENLKWGIIPSWSKNKDFKPLINARLETLFKKPSFTNSNRCLIPADGWYEWKQEDEVKTPYFHHLNGDIFFFGGVFGGYRGKVGCAIVTTDAVESLKNIHERMPLIISRQHFQDWLNGDNIDCSDIFSSKAIINHPVSTHVNNPFNDDPKCVFPAS